MGTYLRASSMDLTHISSTKCFEGEQRVYEHDSKTLGCKMTFGIYLPPAALEDLQPCPSLYFLSGLTCTHENFVQKSGFQSHAAKHGLIVINPDTSPRNVNIPGEDDAYDFGSGASFYVDATADPWAKHYKMYSYITKELIDVVEAYFAIVPNKRSIAGHSMGGHGALICALKNPGLYQSVSVFAPIANPTQCDWGKKAFTGYFGAEKIDEWAQWDATCLAKDYNGVPQELFIDQSNADCFYKQGQLLPENLLAAAEKNKHIQTVYKQRDGYDHGYFYIATFISEHINYHVKFLKS